MTDPVNSNVTLTPIVSAQPKAGIFTSEFWLTLGTIVASVIGFIHLPPVLVVVLVAAYGAFRSIVKVLAPKFVIPDIIQKIIDAINAQAPKSE